MDDVQTRLKNLFVTQWKRHVTSKPKLRTYALFKTHFDTEKYITQNLSRKQRSMLGQLRSGILPLEIETGRFRNIPPHKRICHVCNQNNVENEYHFLFACPLYEVLRRNWFLNMSTTNELF